MSVYKDMLIFFFDPEGLENVSVKNSVSIDGDHSEIMLYNNR